MMKTKILSFLKQWGFYLTCSVIGVASIITIGIASAQIANEKNKPTEKQQIETMKLFASNNANVSQHYASFYASAPVDSQITNKYFNSAAWASALTYLKQPTQSEFNETKLFVLQNPKTAVLSQSYTNNYTISYTSYANDLEGVLYLKATFTPKNSSETNKPFDVTYTLDGFKKLDVNTSNRLTNSLLATPEALNQTQMKEKYSSFENFKQSYMAIPASDKAKQIEFIKSNFPINTLNSTAVLNYDSFNELTFTENRVTLTLKYDIKVANASKDNLEAVKTVPTNQEFTNTYDLSFLNTTAS
ncbi:hypothetical protein FIV53_02340 [Mycoplasma nasistruthionis]|uniref:Uncharacterized protein n=2 Tax=Mycoplasma nasistruthionis TaxID=353852 RepID=A0A4Y6I656_9MOLU|nr:hypothetical protein FIV53_02340 [Mycoplasma nasistruthionis]